MNHETPYKVKIKDQIIRERNGAIAHYALPQALRGVQKGLWDIIDERWPNDQKNKSVIASPILSPIQEEIITGVVSILIIVMNNLHFTMKCIQSIKQYTKALYQLIVVDNGSNDGTLEWLAKNLRQQDIIIRNIINKGFSIGNNQALKNAIGEYILMLNNDTEVQREGWLTPFFQAIRDKDLVGSTLRKVIPDMSAHWFIFGGNGDLSNPWSYLEGWCLFGRRTTFEALGGFDERFSPAYSEDADLSFTARHRGYRLGVVNVPVVHFGSKTSVNFGGQIHTISQENRKKLYTKWLTKSPLSILLKRHGAIGDVLMITPIIRALREKHPKAEIVVETQCPQLLQGNPYITKIVNRIEQNTFDKVINLEYEQYPGEVRIDSMARQAGVKLKNRKMEVFFPETKDGKILPVLLQAPYITIHTGKTWTNREWPIDRFQIMANWLVGHGYQVVQLGDDSTLPLNGKIIDYRNKSWAEVVAIIKRAKVFLGVDSAPSNLAKAVGTPAYIIYGCVNHNIMLADAEEYPLYVPNLECFGCRDKSRTYYVECSQPEIYCLTRLTPEMIIAKLEETLK